FQIGWRAISAISERFPLDLAVVLPALATEVACFVISVPSPADWKSCYQVAKQRGTAGMCTSPRCAIQVGDFNSTGRSSVALTLTNGIGCEVCFGIDTCRDSDQHLLLSYQHMLVEPGPLVAMEQITGIR